MSQIETHDSHHFIQNDKVLDMDSPGTIGNRIMRKLGLASQVAEAIRTITTNNTSQYTRVTTKDCGLGRLQ